MSAAEVSRPGPVWTRRQALKVVAAAAALPLGALALSRFKAEAAVLEAWHGESLGGPASLSLWHPDRRFAQNAIAQMRSEVERLEGVFSLFREDSEISRLNRDGRLESASPDLIQTLAAARDIAAASGGAFDPSIQPLWRLYETHFRARPDDLVGPPSAEVADARANVDYREIAIDGRTVAFARPGMAISLNGIAQGYITDRVADLLRNEGFDHAMVELGETRAVGQSPDGGAWSVGLRNPRHPLSVDRAVDVLDEAVSVSGGYGTGFGLSDSHHIFDPATGLSAHRLLDATVISPRAMTADALSTAIFVAGEAAAPRLLAAYPGARAVLTRTDGTTVSV